MKRKFSYLLISLCVITFSCQHSPEKNSAGITNDENADKTVVQDRNVTVDMTSFFQGALDGDLDKVNEAIAQGADVNAYDDSGHTAMIYAAFNGHHHVIRVLLEKGAKVDAVDGMNRTALMYASTGPFKQAVELLIAKGANVNVIDNNEKWTAVMLAAAEGHLDVVKVLVENGAELNLKDIDGDTALSFAQSNGHSAVVDYIQSQLAK